MTSWGEISKFWSLWSMEFESTEYKQIQYLFEPDKQAAQGVDLYNLFKGHLRYQLHPELPHRPRSQKAAFSPRHSSFS